jgi:hypothetical protein
MISSIKIQGYRGFDNFEMTGLGLLNLLVGTNNSGKTSALEALYLLTSRGDPLSLWQFLWRRGERVPGAPRRPEVEVDICHLFTGHEAHIGSKFTLAANNQSPERSVTFSIAELTAKERSEIVTVAGGNPLPSRLVLHIKGNPQPPVATLPLTRSGGISSDMLEGPPRRLRRRTTEENPAQFITAESLDSDDLVSLWDKVALTPNEELVLSALHFLDPDIERIASQAMTPNYYGGSRGGFIIKRKGYDQPIPIGSMGDGMWRMLALAIAITQCKGGVLLVDEIDTGLHYSVMSDMWRLIFGAAKQFDVQVFATTHSFDCIQSLATVCVSELFPSDVVTLQRIEAGNRKSIPYSQSEIRVAAEKNIEVR